MNKHMLSAIVILFSFCIVNARPTPPSRQRTNQNVPQDLRELAGLYEASQHDHYNASLNKMIVNDEEVGRIRDEAFYGQYSMSLQYQRNPTKSQRAERKNGQEMDPTAVKEIFLFLMRGYNQIRENTKTTE